MKIDLCKHGYPAPCALCAHDDAEHDAAMASLYGGKSLEDMAREAGVVNFEKYAIQPVHWMTDDILARFAALVRAQALDEAAALPPIWLPHGGSMQLAKDGEAFTGLSCFTHSEGDAALIRRDAILALKDRP